MFLILFACSKDDIDYETSKRDSKHPNNSLEIINSGSIKEIAFAYILSKPMFLSLDELTISNFEAVDKVKPEFSFEFNLRPKNEYQIRRLFMNSKGNIVKGWIY